MYGPAEIMHILAQAARQERLRMSAVPSPAHQDSILLRAAADKGDETFGIELYLGPGPWSRIYLFGPGLTYRLQPGAVILEQWEKI